MAFRYIFKFSTWREKERICRLELWWTTFPPSDKAKMEKSDNSWPFLGCGETSAHVGGCSECQWDVWPETAFRQLVSKFLNASTLWLGRSVAKNSSCRSGSKDFRERDTNCSIVCHGNRLESPTWPSTGDWVNQLLYSDNGICKECCPSAGLERSPTYIVKLKKSAKPMQNRVWRRLLFREATAGIHAEVCLSTFWYLCNHPQETITRMASRESGEGSSEFWSRGAAD